MLDRRSSFRLLKDHFGLYYNQPRLSQTRFDRFQQVCLLCLLLKYLVNLGINWLGFSLTQAKRTRKAKKLLDFRRLQNLNKTFAYLSWECKIKGGGAPSPAPSTSAQVFSISLLKSSLYCFILSSIDLGSLSSSF